MIGSPWGERGWSDSGRGGVVSASLASVDGYAGHSANVQLLALISLAIVAASVVLPERIRRPRESNFARHGWFSAPEYWLGRLVLERGVAAIYLIAFARPHCNSAR